MKEECDYRGSNSPYCITCFICFSECYKINIYECVNNMLERKGFAHE